MKHFFKILDEVEGVTFFHEGRLTLYFEMGIPGQSMPVTRKKLHPSKLESGVFRDFGGFRCFCSIIYALLAS